MGKRSMVSQVRNLTPCPHNYFFALPYSEMQKKIDSKITDNFAVILLNVY